MVSSSHLSKKEVSLEWSINLVVSLQHKHSQTFLPAHRTTSFIVVFSAAALEDSWESLGLQGDPTSPSIGRTDAEAETPMLWPPDVKNWLFGKDPDAGKDWRWEEKGMTEDEMVVWHHWLNGHELWVSSRSWWWTGKSDILQSMGSQRVGHDWVTKLNWTAADYVWPWTKSSSFHTTGFKYRQDERICLRPASIFLWGLAGPSGYTKEDPIGSLISQSSLGCCCFPKTLPEKEAGSFFTISPLSSLLLVAPFLTSLASTKR